MSEKNSIFFFLNIFRGFLKISFKGFQNVLKDFSPIFPRKFLLRIHGWNLKMVTDIFRKIWRIKNYIFQGADQWISWKYFPRSLKIFKVLFKYLSRAFKKSFTDFQNILKNFSSIFCKRFFLIGLRSQKNLRIWRTKNHILQEA